jgi:ABC-type Fe3+-hydroxamate transport system substrate-binding protein
MALRKFTDQLGRQIDIPYPPQKIVSVVPSQTELLFDLGLDEELAAITKFCIHPKESVNTKQKVGGTKSLWLDHIQQLEPDLILANKEENSQAEIECLAQKFPVWISDIKNLGDALEMIRTVGEITNKSDRANYLAQTISERFSNIASFSRLRAIYLIWNKPYMTVNSDTFIHDMLGFAGFENMTSSLDQRYPELSLEDLKTMQADVVLLSSEPFPFAEHHKSALAEVLPNSSIHLVDGELFSWYGSRLMHSPNYFINLRQQLTEINR